VSTDEKAAARPPEETLAAFVREAWTATLDENEGPGPWSGADPGGGTAATDGRVVLRLYAFVPGDEAPPEPLWRVLSPGERDRANTFLRPLHRRRFVLAHAAKRLWLSRWLNAPPASIRLAVGEHGKPRVAESTEHGALSFNLSHSGDWMLMAAHAVRPLGVDVEGHRPMTDMPGVARRVFSGEEQAAWERRDEAVRPAWFFRQWTLKEAVVKALGTGLLRDTRRFRVCADQAARSEGALAAGDGLAGRWRVWSLPCPVQSTNTTSMALCLGPEAAPSKSDNHLHALA